MFPLLSNRVARTESHPYYSQVIFPDSTSSFNCTRLTSQLQLIVLCIDARHVCDAHKAGKATLSHITYLDPQQPVGFELLAYFLSQIHTFVARLIRKHGSRVHARCRYAAWRRRCQEYSCCAERLVELLGRHLHVSAM